MEQEAQYKQLQEEFVGYESYFREQSNLKGY